MCTKPGQTGSGGGFRFALKAPNGSEEGQSRVEALAGSRKSQGRAQGAHWVKGKSKSRTRRKLGQGEVEVAHKAPRGSEEGQSRAQGASWVSERSRSL